MGIEVLRHVGFKNIILVMVKIVIATLLVYIGIRHMMIAEIRSMFMALMVVVLKILLQPVQPPVVPVLQVHTTLLPLQITMYQVVEHVEELIVQHTLKIVTLHAQL